MTSSMPDGTLNKLVLDFDSVSKKPLIEVHPQIVKHLKPHQVNKYSTIILIDILKKK